MNWKEFFKNNKHFLFIIYLPIYMKCFTWLEARNNVAFTDIHCFIDDWIPFCEVFIIPYLLWFLYVATVLLFLYVQRDHLEDYYRCIFTLMLGMSTCLFIYYLFPNAQNMRPTEFARENIFTDIIQILYTSDTDTNVLPSIHTYNSIAVHVGFAGCYRLREHKGWKNASLILCILICLSTMCLKQHSILDVIAGIVLYIVYYIVVYKLLPKKCKFLRHDNQTE